MAMLVITRWYIPWCKAWHPPLPSDICSQPCPCSCHWTKSNLSTEACRCSPWRPSTVFSEKFMDLRSSDESWASWPSYKSSWPVYHGLSWFIMVYHGLSWFIMVYHHSPQNPTAYHHFPPWFLARKAGNAKKLGASGAASAPPMASKIFGDVLITSALSFETKFLLWWLWRTMTRRMVSRDNHDGCDDCDDHEDHEDHEAGKDSQESPSKKKQSKRSLKWPDNAAWPLGQYQKLRIQ